MKFYCLTSAKVDNPTTCALFQEACLKRNIEFVRIWPDNFSLAKEVIAPSSLMYRVGTDLKTTILEKCILTKNITTLYSNNLLGISTLSASYFYNEISSLPVIKSVSGNVSNKKILEGYVEYLGGFPLIVKVMGGSHGVGVIKVDSFEGLISLLDFLNKQEVRILLRQFIEHKKQGRLIVLGDKVLASHVNFATLDFRSNRGKNSQRMREATVFSQKVQDIAVQAVKSIGYEFGGVDILFDEQENPYIAEVNTPCFFPTTQKLTQVDIAGAIIDYLIKKATLK